MMVVKPVINFKKEYHLKKKSFLKIFGGMEVGEDLVRKIAPSEGLEQVSLG